MSVDEAKSPPQRRHTQLVYNGVRGAWTCPFHDHASALATQPSEHFKTVKAASVECRWCRSHVPLDADEWMRVEQLVVHYNACVGRALHSAPVEAVLLAGAALPRLAPIAAVGSGVVVAGVAAPVAAAAGGVGGGAPLPFVSNAFRAMVETFEELLCSPSVPVDSLRAMLRVQDLRQDDAQRVLCVEAELKKAKKDVAREIARNLLEPNLELFASKWQIAALLASVLPRRDWNQCFLDKLEARLAAFQLPPSCKVAKISGSTAAELLDSKNKAVAALDNIQRILSASTKDYKLLDAKKRLGSQLDDASDALAKKNASAAVCSRGHLSTAADAMFCMQCGEKL